MECRGNSSGVPQRGGRETWNCPSTTPCPLWCALTHTGKEAFKGTGETAHGNSASEFSSLLMKFFLKNFFTFLFICMGVVHSACKGQRATDKTELSPPTIWVPRIELALSGLAASPSPH